MRMRQARLFILVGISIVLLITIAAIGATAYFFRGIDRLSSCDETLQREALSPDGKYIASIYTRNCGATTEFVTHLNVGRANKKLKKNLQGALAEGEVFTLDEKANMEVEWKDNDRLIVQWSSDNNRDQPPKLRTSEIFLRDKPLY